MKPQQRDKRDKPDKRVKRDYIFGKFGERDMFKPQSDYQDHKSQVTGHRPSWDRIRCHHCHHCHHCILGTVELLGSITNTCKVSSVSRLVHNMCTMSYNTVQSCQWVRLRMGPRNLKKWRVSENADTSAALGHL